MIAINKEYTNWSIVIAIAYELDVQEDHLPHIKVISQPYIKWNFGDHIPNNYINIHNWFWHSANNILVPS